MKRKIVSHSDILGGKPHIVGTHITVSSIINKIISGLTVKQIVRQFPQISEDDVITALKFAEEVVSKPFSIEVKNDE